MAITSSTIKIYEDSAKTTLAKTVTTSGGSTAIPVDSLSEGKAYWATAQVVNDGVTSAESAVYQFYTLPNLVWDNVNPFVWNGGTRALTYRMLDVTDTVDCSQRGVMYSLSSDMSNPTTFYDPDNRTDGTITGLAEDTTYYFCPILVDEFNRPYTNTSAKTDYDTGYYAPSITWTGSDNTTSTTWSNAINITSTPNLTSVVLTYTPSGGSAQTTNLSTTTGAQNVSLSGLTPNTTYTIYITATSSAGTTTSSTRTVSTTDASLTLSLSGVTVDNRDNGVTVTSTASYDASAITLGTHTIGAYLSEDHTTTPEATITSSNGTFTGEITGLDPDTRYYIYSSMTYTVAGDATTRTAWSLVNDVDTYTLFDFGTVTVTNTSATIPYTVSGTATSVTIEYSLNNQSWASVPNVSTSSSTVTLSGLTPGTIHYLRGRAQNTDAGWCGYDTDTFTTTADAGTVTISSVSNVTPTTATVNFTVA